MKQNLKHKSIGFATLKTLGTQYTMYSDMLRQVTDLYSEFDSELSQALSLVHQKSASQNAPTKHNNDSTECSDVSPYNSVEQTADSGSCSEDNQSIDDIDSDQPPWLKKLFKKIAIHCHPDKVLPSNFDVVEKHHRMASYDKARKALDLNDKPLLISVGLVYDEIAEIGAAQSKKILATGVKDLETDLATKQASLIWSWGMSEDNLGVKAKILIHAAAQFYNVKLSTEDALRVIKEFFEIYEPKSRRKVGHHPGSRLQTIRNDKK